MILSKKPILILGILIISLNILSANAFPQNPYPIFGHIYESNGSGVENAKVTITNLNTSESTFDFTISNGEYIIDLSNLPHGYSIGDYIRIDAEKDTRTGHKSLVLVDFFIFDQENKNGININLTPFKLLVESTPKTIRADGVSNSTITVTLTDIKDVPIETEIATIVNLSTDLGSITNQIVIPAGHSSGIARLLSSQKSGIAIVSVSSKGLVSDHVKVGFIGEGAPFRVKISTNKKSIPADGKSTATISLSLWSENDELVQTKMVRSILVESSLGDLSTNKIKIPVDSAISNEDILISSMSSGNATIKAYSENLETGTETIIFTPLGWLYVLAGIGGIIGEILAIFIREKGSYYYEPTPPFPKKDGKRWHLGIIGNVIVSSLIGFITFVIINTFASTPQNYITAFVLGFAGGILGLQGLKLIVEKYVQK